ncbi:hypothetical protein L5515_004649 [Caenorhabditis briggsae]|uniref:C-type lectin domain-containing protein n=1 Tax=Caenorhabditis briggsae TaxID=6238 RepID=A0AAE9EM07_CAEBR|nr:hypothetical protein L5515_004649 [Caenorhabditis briggsae]
MFAKTLPLLLFSLLFLQIDAQCGTGAIYVQQMNKCLQFYSSAVNYATAESVCSTLNGHMVSVHNMNENTYLAQQASQLIYKNGPVWLGAKTMSSIVTDPTSWKWEDGSPFDFQNYKIGQPSSLGTSACMQFFANDGQWLTATCTDSSPFICASDPPLSSTTACPPSQVRCPHGYVWFAATNYCYKTVIEQASFYGADNACQRDGARLASIHSAFENDFLASISNTGIKVDYTKNLNIWIGLYYSDGYWKWIDGTPADYANWASREPNNVTYGMVVFGSIRK